MKKIFIVFLVVLLAGCVSSVEEKQNTAAIDNFVAQYPLPMSDAPIDPSKYMVDEKDETAVKLYKFVINESTLSEIDMVHAFPNGGAIKCDIYVLLPILLASSIELDRSLAQLMGDSITTILPQSIALMDFENDDPTAIRAARSLDQNLPIEVKSWLYQIGEHKVRSSFEATDAERYFCNILLMQKLTQRRIHALQKKLQALDTASVEK